MCAGLLQLAQHGIERIGTRVARTNLATGHRCSHQKRAGLDTIGQHFVLRTMQPLNAMNDQRRAAGALDLGTHRDQTMRQIDYFRFLRSVFDHRGAARQRCGHHDVFGTGNGNHVHHDPRPLQSPGARKRRQRRTKRRRRFRGASLWTAQARRAYR